MQGVFRLGIVGSKEELLDFIEKSKQNKVLKKNWIVDEDAIETGGGLRSICGSGLDKYKLVFGDGDSCNVNGLDEIADEISAISPELEVILLKQTFYDARTDWFVYYCPSGEKKTIRACITKGEEGMCWEDIQNAMSDSIPSIDVDKVLEYYAKNKSHFESNITKEILEYHIAKKEERALGETDDDEYEEIGDSCDSLLDEFFDEESESIEYYFSVDDKNLPSLAYISRLFNMNFVKHYRFIPQTFDNRFEGKVFVATGRPDDYGLEKTKEYISKFGGIVHDALSGKTNYLVAGDYTGNAEIAKAKELGTQIIDVEVFEKMISE